MLSAARPCDAPDGSGRPVNGASTGAVVVVVRFEVDEGEASSEPPPPHAAKAKEPEIAIAKVANEARFTLLAEYLFAPRAVGAYRMRDLATYVSSLRGQVLDRVGTRSIVEPLLGYLCALLTLHHAVSRVQMRDQAGSG